jgi:hypothetical protein
MFTKRNVILVAGIACALLVLTTPWNVIADEGGVIGAGTNAPWRLDGAWMMKTAGAVLEPVIFTAQDSQGDRYTMVMEDAECNYKFYGMFPTATDHSHLVGVCVRTGPHTFESTVVGFVVERYGLESGFDKVLYHRVITHAFEFVDENNVVATSNWAQYMPDQDADHDGFPDLGQEPFAAGSPATTMRRVGLIPHALVPEPPQE